MPDSEDFWNEVLKRWSDASSCVLKLRKELEQVRQERDHLRNATGKVVDAQIATQEGIRDKGIEERGVNVSKLNELEAGIGKAQESYRKLEEQLSNNASKIHDLMANNEQLRRERGLLEQQRRDLHDALKRAEEELKELRSQNESLHEKLSSVAPKPVIADESPVVEMSEEAYLRNEIEKVHKPKVLTLQHELEALRKANRALEEEKRLLQEDLHSAREKLSKYRLSNKSVHEKFMHLSELTRQRSVHSLRPSIHLASGSQAETESPVMGHRRAGQLPPAPSVATFGRQPSKKSSANTVDEKTAVNLSRSVEITFVEDDASTPRPPSTPVKLPAFRQRQISRLPTIVPTVSVRDAVNSFSREFMTISLGANLQSLLLRAGKQSNVSKHKKNPYSYLCPGVDHNPWCPTTPGHHGYLFVGLGREKDSFAQPEIHHVFVGLRKSDPKKSRTFKYLGKYRVLRVNSLTPGEWSNLSNHDKHTYAKSTKVKAKDSRSIEEILAAYDQGDLLVPCVQLQCVGFDEVLYSALLAENAKPKQKQKLRSSSVPSNKRGLDDYEADDDCARKKRTVKKTS